MTDAASSLPLSARLAAAAARRPPRAESVRRFVNLVLSELPPDAEVEALDERRSTWLAEEPPQDELAARRVLAAEDLGPILAEMTAMAPIFERWRVPLKRLRASRDASLAALSATGVELTAPDIHLGDGLPPAYDHPMLSAVSIDETDAAHFGLAPGLHFDERRLVPGLTEATLAHVLVHAALGQRSPERLGRGLEEGICETLGALHAGVAAAGDDVEAAIVAARVTPWLGAQRASFLAWVRAAALLHRRHGLAGLSSLVREGRAAIKAAERALLDGRPENVELPEGEPEAGLSARLERVLELRCRPVAVAPLALYLCRGLQAGRTVSEVARELGVPVDAATAAASELVDSAFVLLLSPDGEVLVDDLQVVSGTTALRYGCPMS